MNYINCENFFPPNHLITYDFCNTILALYKVAKLFKDRKQEIVLNFRNTE